jgi:hypothetical protein
MGYLGHVERNDEVRWVLREKNRGILFVLLD